MDTSLQEQWARKSRFLTQALILSGALNIGLLSSFFYFIVREKKEAVAFELQPVVHHTNEKITNSDTLANFAMMSYAELIALLKSQEPIEEGYKTRDLALASLAMFHFVNVDKALQGFPLQKRTLSFRRKDGPEQVTITVYPGLGEDQFKAILQFIKTEKFPLTTEGLFFELQQSKMPRDPSLLEAFYLTPEFTTIMTLFTRARVPLPHEYVVDLLTQGDWNLLQQFTVEQRQMQDLSPDRFKYLLSSYIKSRSLMAAKILLEWDHDFILKRFEDPDLIAFIDLFTEKSTSFECLLKELIASPRSDRIRGKAAEKLSVFGNCDIPPVKEEKQIHIVQPGENLWKIARKYKVSIETLKKINHLETDKLRPGKELVITDDLHHPDAKDDTGKSGVQ